MKDSPHADRNVKSATPVTFANTRGALTCERRILATLAQLRLSIQSSINAGMTKILYFVTEDWFFVSRFLPMARAARAAGMEVVVAARLRHHGARLEAEGVRVVPLDVERKSLAPLEGIRNFVCARKIVRAERPDIVH